LVGKVRQNRRKESGILTTQNGKVKMKKFYPKPRWEEIFKIAIFNKKNKIFQRMFFSKETNEK